ncbi:MAG: radical SAM peptide maturase, CXXX-repeat target family [Ruminococcus flavefaciens]|nr:radical SAM peptide maturase, CXXX-repeat target family [Ruminococcus flavefaciens]
MRPRIEEFNSIISRLYPDKDRAVRTVTIQVTDACNLRCTYCYQIDKKNHYIPVELACQYLKIILDGDNPYINMDNTYGMILDFIGGEPFLAIDQITEITDWTIGYMIDNQHPWLTKFRINICSNGTLYFDPRVQKYLERYHNLVSLSFSIDGNRELHDACRIFPDGRGSYDMAVHAVQHYSAKYCDGYMPGTKLTLSPDNIQYFADAHINLIQSLHYETIHCNCCFEEGWTNEHARLLYHEMNKLTDWLFENDMADKVYISIYEPNIGVAINDDKNWCGGTGAMVSVDWKGDIYPCIRYMESSLGTDQPPLIIGNVRDGIMCTEEQRNCVECLKAITRTSQSTEECIKCPISAGCAWCSGYNYQKFGTVNKRATFICCMHKARVLANLYFWKKWNQRYPDDSEQGCIVNNVPDEWALEIIGEDELNRLKAIMAE